MDEHRSVKSAEMIVHQQASPTPMELSLPFAVCPIPYPQSNTSSFITKPSNVRMAHVLRLQREQPLRSDTV